jgi:hypothetical protein
MRLERVIFLRIGRKRERPVFGEIRYIGRKGTVSKFDTAAIEKY